jgi:hypothetical protein
MKYLSDMKKLEADQQKLFEVKTRIQNLIDSLESQETGNVVHVKIPRLPKFVKEYAPQCFKK